MDSPKLDEAGLFNAARKIDAADLRRMYLDQACGGDRALQTRLQALLRAYDADRHFLTAPAEGIVTLSAERVTEGPGTQVGPYRLLKQIGEGGMGTVFLAEQSEPLRRQVAVKVIRPGMDSCQVLARFEVERQALALMDHPNIAKVLDAGMTPTGRPYFVMELIGGEPLTAYCDRARLSVRDRLELFVPVCQAVQHAHQKGIIHRDLKPSNVLVTLYDGKAVPKVIDFGIAKATGPKLTERTLETEVGSVVGTLEYMSPEQAEPGQADVDTRSDIYSLGVLLYELLTGTTPLEPTRREGAGLLDLLRAVRESDSPRPSMRLSTTEMLPEVAASRGVEPRRLVGLVRGDLDWIVMTCLERDRARRYETADALTRDVERHLNLEPVEACPPSPGYRLRKFARKHRGPVLAASVMAVLLLCGILGTSLGFLRAERLRHLAEEREREAVKEKARAEASQQRAMDALRATTEDVIEQLLGAKPGLGSVEKAFLQATLKRWQTFAAEQGEGKQARAIRAEGVFRVARLRQMLGQKDEVVARYEEAIELSSKLAADFPAEPEYRRDLAVSHMNLGILLADLGKRPEAEAAYRLALSIQEKLAADFPAVPQYRQDLAKSHMNLGMLLADLEKHPEAEAAYRQALSIQEKLVADFPDMPQYRQDLAKSHNNLGMLLADLGKRPEAEAAYRQAISIKEKLVADFPDVPQYHQDLAASHHNLGMLLADLGKRPEAETAYRQAISIKEKLVADFPAVPQYRRDLALSHMNLGVLLRALGKRPEAEAAYRQALSIQEKLVADFPAVPQYRQDLASNHDNLGMLLLAVGKRPEAEAAYRQALSIQEKLVADFPGVPQYCQDLAKSHNNLGMLLLAVGKRPEAETAYRQALSIQEKLAADFPAVPQYRRDLAANLINLGNLLLALGKRPEAETAYRQALSIQEKLVADSPAVPQYRRDLAISHMNLGMLLLAVGKRPEAEAAYRQALSIQEKLAADFPDVPQYCQDLAKSHNNLGNLLLALRKRPEAEAAYRQALSIQEKLAADFPALPTYRVGLGGSQVNFGNFEQRNQQPQQALPWYARGIETLEGVLRQVKVDATAQQYLRNAHWGRALALEDLKRHAEAMKDWDQAVELSPEPERPEFRMSRAASRVRAGQVDAAIQEAEELAKNADAGTLYNAACVFALAADRRDEPGGSLSKEQCAQRAVALLQQAVAKGWKNSAHLKKDDDLKALRQRDDFKKLLAELEAGNGTTSK